MRLDKFLKVSRLIKRRSVAKDAADSERVYVNNLLAKPSKNIEIGDLVTICYGTKKVTIKVLSILDSTKKADAKEMFEMVNIEEIKQEN